MPVCVEGLERYSLQSDTYLFVLNCPSNAFCGGVNEITMACCDGTLLHVLIPEDSSDELRQQIIQAMLNEAGRRLAFCTEDDGTGGGGGGGGTIGRIIPTYVNGVPVIYYNRLQQCNSPCPGGQPFITYIQPGRFIGFSQEIADTLAKQEACAIAQQGRLCLTGFSVACCEDSAFSRTVTVTGPGVRPMQFWSVTQGNVPPGITVPTGWFNGPSIAITGTPTTPGTYTFTLQVMAQTGLYQYTNCTICVIGASPDTLPDGEEGVAYSQTMTAPACATPPLSWQISAGALPAGLTLNETTGVISGTPTVHGDFNFTLLLQTEAT